MLSIGGYGGTLPLRSWMQRCGGSCQAIIHGILRFLNNSGGSWPVVRHSMKGAAAPQPPHNVLKSLLNH